MTAGVYQAWAAGVCPCCSSALDSWPAPDGRTVEPAAIGEGVMLCGRCIGNRHHEDPPGFAGLLLRAIAERSDACVGGQVSFG